MANEDYEDMVATVGDTADYYSDITGRNISMGVDTGLDVWLDTTRTNGREYFDSLEEAERRVKLLYQDLIEDEDDGIDPFGDF